MRIGISVSMRYAEMGASWIFKAAFVGEFKPLLTNPLPLHVLDELAKARSPTRADRPSLPPEAKAVSAQFAEFLKTRVKSVGITDLSRNIQSFIDKVHKRVETLPIEQVSVMVQNFYQVSNFKVVPCSSFKLVLDQALNRRLETHDNFVGLTEDERTHICDLSER